MIWSTYEKRGFLRSIRSQAVKATQNLEAALLAVVEGRAISVAQGRINVNFSDGSTSSSYIAPAGKSQSDVMSLAGELMDLRDQVEASLPAPIDDDAIVSGMMAHPQLTGATESYADFSELKLPWSYQKIV